MNVHYRHRQIGYFLIIALAFGFLMFALFCASIGFNWILFIGLIVMGLCLVEFSTLTVVVNNDYVKIRFTIGIIKKNFLLKEIESCKIVNNPWYYGLGIHFTPNGLVYNVSGTHAVEIRMNTGKKYRIGTDVPDELEEAIRQSIT